MIPRSRALQILAGVLAVLALLVILAGVTLVAEGPGHVPGQGIAWGSAPEREPANALASTCTVTSTDDNGLGTLRACLVSAVDGDVITFHPDFFPPTNPVTIGLETILPHIITDALGMPDTTNLLYHARLGAVVIAFFPEKRAVSRPEQNQDAVPLADA